MTKAKHEAAAAAASNAGAPAQAGLVLGTLIIVAAVANLPLAMANVALPSIGAYFDASQVQLNLVAVSYSLGLACSVLWLGALGDHYGRKLLALIGVALAVPAALIAGFAPSLEILIFARLLGGFAAGMAYPTTLSLIAALWGREPGARARSRCGRRLAPLSRCSARCCPASSCKWPPGPGCSGSSSRWRWWRW
jgi:MFS family permease